MNANHSALPHVHWQRMTNDHSFTSHAATLLQTTTAPLLLSGCT